MQQYIADNINRTGDRQKLEQLVQLIDEDVKKSISVDDLWAEIKSKHSGLMKRLA